MKKNQLKKRPYPPATFGTFKVLGIAARKSWSNESWNKMGGGGDGSRNEKKRCRFRIPDEKRIPEKAE